MDILNSIVDFVQNSLMSQVVLLGGVLDFAMRLFKTEKPMSLLYVIRGALDIALAVVVKIVDLIKGLIAFLDKLLPQRVVAPSQPQQPPQA